MTVKMAISPTNRLVFSSAFVGGMNAACVDNFLTQARTNLDPKESVILVYDGAPAHRNPSVPALNTELKMLPPNSPFLNIVKQAISCLKVAIKANTSRQEFQRRMDDRDEARVRGIPLVESRTQQLHLFLPITVPVAQTLGWLTREKTMRPGVQMSGSLTTSHKHGYEWCVIPSRRL